MGGDETALPKAPILFAVRAALDDARRLRGRAIAALLEVIDRIVLTPGEKRGDMARHASRLG